MFIDRYLLPGMMMIVDSLKSEATDAEATVKAIYTLLRQFIQFNHSDLLFSKLKQSLIHTNMYVVCRGC